MRTTIKEHYFHKGEGRIKNLAKVVLVALGILVMGFLDAAWAIDGDRIAIDKLGKPLDNWTRDDLLKFETINLTTPTDAKFEIAKTTKWVVAEKLASEGWELIGAFHFPIFRRIPGREDIGPIAHGTLFMFRRPLKK